MGRGKEDREGEGEEKGERKEKVEGRELKKSWTHGRTNGHSVDFILCSVLCIALDRQKEKQVKCEVKKIKLTWLTVKK